MKYIFQLSLTLLFCFCLLGIKPIKKTVKTDTRLQRRVKQIEKLETKDKRQVMQMLDTFIENAQLKEKIRKAS